MPRIGSESISEHAGLGTRHVKSHACRCRENHSRSCHKTLYALYSSLLRDIQTIYLGEISGLQGCTCGKEDFYWREVTSLSVQQHLKSRQSFLFRSFTAQQLENSRVYSGSLLDYLYQPDVLAVDLEPRTTTHPTTTSVQYALFTP